MIRAWVVMMLPMMLPSLVPMLLHYRHGAGSAGGTRPGRLTLLVGAGYYFVWTLIGLAVSVLGVAISAAETRLPALARAAPMAVAVVVLMAGMLQLTRWKAQHLACWRSGRGLRAAASEDAGTAWRYGLRLGVRCGYCCGNLMAIVLVIGVMDLRAMALVTASVTAERVAPAGARVAHGIGAVVVAIGAILMARAAGIG